MCGKVLGVGGSGGPRGVLSCCFPVICFSKQILKWGLSGGLAWLWQHVDVSLQQGRLLTELGVLGCGRGGRAPAAPQEGPSVPLCSHESRSPSLLVSFTSYSSLILHRQEGSQAEVLVSLV